MAAATILQLLVWPFVEPAPILLFYPAILLACLYGEGYSSIALAMIIIPTFFIEPYGHPHMSSLRDIIRMVVFVPTALLIKLITDRMIKLKKEADEAIVFLQEEKELREKFVSTLSHDLQTPIASMKIAVSLMVKKKSDQESFDRNAERMFQNMHRLENMIKDLLDANKIRGGKLLPVEIVEMDMNECLHETVRELCLIYGDRFVYNQNEPLKGYWCKDALQRILENLCTNAVKYGYPDTPITITTEKTPEQIKLHVHNHGPVIDGEEREYLFEAFARARSAQLSKKKGWGLGLTLVKGLSEAMKGNVTVKSDQEGTIFTVTLPLDARIKKEIAV